MTQDLASQSPVFDPLRASLGTVMLRDRHRLGQTLRQLETGKTGPDWAARLARLEEQLAASSAQAAARQRSLPAIRLDESLPIAARAQEIGRLIREHQVVIVAGETGSGKSTQLPLIALQAGFGIRGMIGHTQPRRIAARSVAARLAEELNQPLGQSIGYQVRFHDQSSPLTLAKVMTDGILLAETQSDRYLNQYDLLIVDEAHERSLNIDFVLGWLRQLIDRREDLHLVITSATMDTARFAEHFSRPGRPPAPVVEVEGRSFPVEVRFQPPESGDDDEALHEELLTACSSLLGEVPGDVLVFLPTESEIRAVHKKLRGSADRRLAGTDVLPLYGRLADHQQAEVFRPHARPRIVLATNVAESSITVPGVRSVVDCGTARISRYAPRSKVQRLPVEPVSQASANQRAGRCGRVGPGVCIRLYSAEDFETRPAFTTPEIRRTNLAGTLLRLAALGVADIDQFPLLDPPQPESIRDGYRTLFEIGATDGDRRLTAIGRRLAKLPVDPRIGRILLEAADQGCLADMLVVASALETQDPRVRPAEKRGAADEAHRQFQSPAGDYMTLLQMWDAIHRWKSDLSRARFRKALEQNFLSPSLVNEWQEVHRQLLAMVTDQGLRPGSRGAAPEVLHVSLLAGFLSGVAMLDSPREYLGAGGVRFQLWPGSALFEDRPTWILAGEILETTRRYGRMVAPIQPGWIEPLAGHLVKRNHVDPWWSDKQGTAMVHENVLLFGLPVVTRRKTGLASIDPAACRDLFLQEGLVGNQIRHEFPFHRHNEETLQLVSDMATRLRDRQSIVKESQLESFYRERLPAEAVDVRSLRELIQKDPGLDARLRLSVSDLGIDETRLEDAAAMPAMVEVGNLRIPVEYRFAPGHEEDGASLRIPLPAVGQLDPAQLHWLIPQLVRDRVISLIRTLPKQVRRLLVPAPDIADRVLQKIPPGDPRFAQLLAAELSRLAGEPVTTAMFDWEKVDRHLLLNLQVVDDQGAVVAQSRTLTGLREQLGPAAAPVPVALAEGGEWHRDGLKEWVWDQLPEKVPVPGKSPGWEAWPALVDQGEAVGLRLLANAEAASQASFRGLLRLLQLQHRKLLRSQVAWLPEGDMLRIRFSQFVPPSVSETALRDLLVRIGLEKLTAFPRTRAEYSALAERTSQSIAVATQEVAQWFPKLVRAGLEAQRQLSATPAKYAESAANAKRHLAWLTGEGFLQQVPWQWLQHFPRYLQAIQWRLEKLPTTPPKVDGDRWRSVERWEQQWQQLHTFHQTQGWVDPELERFRWMLEEFRVSLFAQQLGTSLPVSEKRLEKQLQSVRR